MEYKAATFAIKSFSEETGTVEGYASTYGNQPDSYGDIVTKGAFAKTIQERRPRMLWAHDSKSVIGVWDEVFEDERGLFVRGRFADTELARDVRSLVAMGAIDSMSIGFMINDAEKTGPNTRTLKEVELYEVSIVTFPANESAVITGVKGEDENNSNNTSLHDDQELINALNIRVELLNQLCKGNNK